MTAVKDAGTRPAPHAPATPPTPWCATIASPPAKALAWGFTAALADKLALRIDLGYGTAHVNIDVAAATDFNTLRVESPVSATTLTAHAAELFPTGPRHIAIRDDAVAVPLLPALVAAGYEPRRTVVLTPARRTTRPRADLTLRPARPLGGGTLDWEDADLDTAHWDSRHRPLRRDQVNQARLGDVLRSRVARTSRMTVWAPERHQGTRAPASRAMVTTMDGASEIGRVFTAAAHRRRGFATAAVAAALHQSAGTRRFARVDAGDPVMAVLTRSGLAPSGSWWELTRPA